MAENMFSLSNLMRDTMAQDRADDVRQETQAFNLEQEKKKLIRMKHEQVSGNMIIRYNHALQTEDAITANRLWKAMFTGPIRAAMDGSNNSQFFFRNDNNPEVYFSKAAQGARMRQASEKLAQGIRIKIDADSATVGARNLETTRLNQEALNEASSLAKLGQLPEQLKQAKINRTNVATINSANATKLKKAFDDGNYNILEMIMGRESQDKSGTKYAVMGGNLAKTLDAFLGQLPPAEAQVWSQRIWPNARKYLNGEFMDNWENLKDEKNKRLFVTEMDALAHLNTQLKLYQVTLGTLGKDSVMAHRHNPFVSVIDVALRALDKNQELRAYFGRKQQFPLDERITPERTNTELEALLNRHMPTGSNSEIESMKESRRLQRKERQGPQEKAHSKILKELRDAQSEYPIPQ